MDSVMILSSPLLFMYSQQWFLSRLLLHQPCDSILNLLITQPLQALCRLMSEFYFTLAMLSLLYSAGVG